jgi:hypothetical protein
VSYDSNAYKEFMEKYGLKFEIATKEEKYEKKDKEYFVYLLDNKDFVQRMKVEREKGICYFWTITLKEEKTIHKTKVKIVVLILDKTSSK